jgi:FkbM family methyltransferase
VWAGRRALFRWRLRWQLAARPRIARATWLSRRLPWRLWCYLCAADAETVVRELGRRRDALSFVQIGSNDGMANDPLRDTVRARGWSGVLVEPIPRLCEQLMANYEGVPGLRFANVAIAGTEGRVTLYAVKARPGDPAWVEQIASLDREVVMRHAYALPDLDGRIVSIEVEAVPLPVLVARYDLRTIDLVHIDAEGLDYEIIRQIPLGAAWAPRNLIFEAKHMSREQFAQIKARLRGGGYRIVSVWPDQFAYR